MSVERIQLTPAQFRAREAREAAENGGRYVTFQELAKMIGVGVDTLRDWRRRRWILPAVETGKVMRFHYPSVRAQLEKRMGPRKWRKS